MGRRRDGAFFVLGLPPGGRCCRCCKGEAPVLPQEGALEAEARDGRTACHVREYVCVCVCRYVCVCVCVVKRVCVVTRVCSRILLGVSRRTQIHGNLNAQTR